MIPFGEHAPNCGKAHWAGRIFVSSLLVACTLVLPSKPAAGQEDPIHYFHAADLPPGVVAAGQLMRYDLLSGYVQPVEVQLPEGVRVSFNIGGQFDEARPGPVRVGMQVGPVYQLKISHIPFREGSEVFPTIEVINRLYPPPGQVLCFPIPVQFTREELDFAVEGRFVTRVIYLEDAATALPVRDDPHEQRYFDVPQNQDPLRVADRLGRPMAILRMGSRIPDGDAMLSSCPPVMIYDESLVAPSRQPRDTSGLKIDRAIERPEKDIPRVYFPRGASSANR